MLGKKSKKLTLKQLQQICGFLNFLGRCIVPGRAFTRWLYSYTAGRNRNLKPHHHIRINVEMRADLLMWNKFIHHQSIYARGFLDFTPLQADHILMFSDAAKKVGLGYSGVCEDSWMFGVWDEKFLKEKDPSIAYLELYALVATTLNWIHRFANRRVVLFCDNQSVVQIVNKTTSSCKHCMILIKILVLNVRVFATYIKSEKNLAADYLSRLKLTEFRWLRKSWDECPMLTLEQLVPITKVW